MPLVSSLSASSHADDQLIVETRKQVLEALELALEADTLADAVKSLSKALNVVEGRLLAYRKQETDKRDKVISTLESLKGQIEEALAESLEEHGSKCHREIG